MLRFFITVQSANHMSCQLTVCGTWTAVASTAPVCKRALNKYIETRPRASAESVRRAKEIRSAIVSLPVHPIFSGEAAHVDTQKESILQMLRSRRLPTIFEALGKHANPEAFKMIMRKRKLHDPIISRAHEKQSKRAKQTADYSEEVAEEVIGPAKDTTFFVPSVREDEASERGLSTRTQDAVGGNFVLSAEAASFDVQGDEFTVFTLDKWKECGGGHGNNIGVLSTVDHAHPCSSGPLVFTRLPASRKIEGKMEGRILPCT
ncbi:unnamed protein product [Dibothriocephalus latus]|uniref:Uncharacterized protein n=1 Tax=Dibothriocephalus latus TaxID=60516 RepID=A0A3P7LJJ5_DIBLA|nr:unnamed protein product [Dibothriocephalus latus]